MTTFEYERVVAPEAATTDILIHETYMQQAEKQLETATVDAFGCTFVLAPSWSAKVAAEEAFLVSTYAAFPGLAIIMQSEMQPRCKFGSWEHDMLPFLCEDARRVYKEDNAGGSSYISESMSMELLSRAFSARLIKTECQLLYWPSNSAMTDFSIMLGGSELGVSVTRAMTHPAYPFGLEDAAKLLRKKLSGVNKSTQACCNADWKKQILHIWAGTQEVAHHLEQAYGQMEPELISDTLVLITLCTALPELFTEKATIRASAARPLKGTKDDAHLRVLEGSDPTKRRC